MRILLDSNIIIPLEDSSRTLDESFSELARLAAENSHQLIAHPASLDDIRRDRDERRREISLSRIRRYPLLENPPIPNQEDLDQLGIAQADDNDRVDNAILYAVYKDAVNILVTEDKELHRKAARIGLEDRVYYIQQATESLRRLHARIPVFLPNIEELSLHQLDLESPFFDSLRVGYRGFDEWFRNASRDGRKAWAHRDTSGQPAAIAIYKEENNPTVTVDGKRIAGKVLKISTFKVGEGIRGKKIGELLLKAAFRYASNNRFEHIYLTMRPGEQPYLERLCVDFGFYPFGEAAVDGEIDGVYVKEHPVNPPAVRDFPSLEYHKRYFPHFMSSLHQDKYIVPIMPTYHAMLFPDNQRQPELFSYSAAGNAIKQAYLCNARINGIDSGDILLFYRSHDLRAITSVGIVESSHKSQDADKILQLVSKRTVYTYDDIRQMSERQTKVILFRLAAHFLRDITYDWLKDEEVVHGPIQTIRKISDESFRKIIRRGELRNCFYAD